jgi:AcrR family transcriptional regulator
MSPRRSANVTSAGDSATTVTARPAPVSARGRRTRAALVEAARGVFEEYGFRDAKIADIARRSGASYGSFYTHFDSKEAIFRQVVNAVAGEMFAVSHPDSDATGPYERIRVANERYLRAYAENAGVLRVLEEMAAYNDYFRELRLRMRNLFVQRNARGIGTLQAAGLANPELDPLLAASLLGGMVERAAYLWFVLGDPYEEESAVETLTRLWAAGIGLTDVSETHRSSPRTPVEASGAA